MSADHRFGRPPVRVDPQEYRRAGGQIRDPFVDRGVGAVAGDHSADALGVPRLRETD
jgi:hypothetical protein